jgi:hypothetical protein
MKSTEYRVIDNDQYPITKSDFSVINGVINDKFPNSLKDKRNFSEITLAAYKIGENYLHLRYMANETWAVIHKNKTVASITTKRQFESKTKLKLEAIN